MLSFLFVGLCSAALGILYWSGINAAYSRLFNTASAVGSDATSSASISTAPSLLFVFGAPLGDNNSPTWVMMLKHFGPGAVHNCKIEFF